MHNVQIIKVVDSPLKNKRFRVLLSDNTYYDFGSKNGSTYIDHKDQKKRIDYIHRHLSNPEELRRFNNLIPSPSLFSSYLLWGLHDNLEDNIRSLNILLKNGKKGLFQLIRFDN